MFWLILLESWAKAHQQKVAGQALSLHILLVLPSNCQQHKLASWSVNKVDTAVINTTPHALCRLSKASLLSVACVCCR